MPAIVDSLANHDGNDLIKDQNTPGGHRLNLHSTNAVSLSKIASDNWDYVVLQDQSQFPSFPYNQVIVDVYPHAKILCDSIRSANACAIPLFFNTWGRRDGDPQWDSIDTFTEMNQRLHAAYSHMANVNSGKLSPVGIAFQHIYNEVNPTVAFVDLYNADGSHPSIQGSYLAACIFYNMIFETSPVGNTYVPNNLMQNEATYLQNVAHHVVNDVDSSNIDYTQPIADFTFSQNGSVTNFNNTSQHGFTYHWDFGDNLTSDEENPMHNYNQNGTYTVTLTAEYCGRQDQVSYDILIDHLGVSTPEALPFHIYPNPSSGPVIINVDYIAGQVEIYNMRGQIVHSFIPVVGTNSINLNQGIYVIKCEELTQKLIIN